MMICRCWESVPQLTPRERLPTQRSRRRLMRQLVMKLTLLKSTITKYDRGNPYRIPQHSRRYPFRSLCRKLRQQTTLAAVGTLVCAAPTVCAQSRAVTAPSTNGTTFRWAGTSNRIYVEGG